MAKTRAYKHENNYAKLASEYCKQHQDAVPWEGPNQEHHTRAQIMDSDKSPNPGPIAQDQIQWSSELSADGISIEKVYSKLQTRVKVRLGKST